LTDRKVLAVTPTRAFWKGADRPGAAPFMGIDDRIQVVEVPARFEKLELFLHVLLMILSIKM
jgi:hypothetical protein